jgi:hypothetical protein
VQTGVNAANSSAWNLVDVKDDEVAGAKRSHSGDQSGGFKRGCLAVAFLGIPVAFKSTAPVFRRQCLQL